MDEGTETIEEVDAAVDALQANSNDVKAEMAELRDRRFGIKDEIADLLRKRAALIALRAPSDGDVTVDVPGPGGAA